MSGDVGSKIIVFIFSIVLISMISIMISNRAIITDPESGCLVGQKTDSISVILFDQSDEFEQGDYDRAKILVTKILESLKKNEKLLFLELNPKSAYEPIVLFNKCAPKNPVNVNIIIESEKKLKKEMDQFTTSFFESTEVSFKRKRANSSPILESLAYVVKRPDFVHSESKRIYIFSDMIQNSKQLNFYKRVPVSSELKNINLPIGELNFIGANVHMLYVARRSMWGGRNRIKKFWDEWFRSKGAYPKWDSDISVQ